MSEKTFTRRIITEYRTPEGALRLNEDIQALVRIQHELRSVDPYNVSDDSQKGRRLIRFVQGQLKMAERHARDRMQKEFLVPQKKILNGRREQRSNVITNEIR